jgi:hypothetical protein
MGKYTNTQIHNYTNTQIHHLLDNVILLELGDGDGLECLRGRVEDVVSLLPQGLLLLLLLDRLLGLQWGPAGHQNDKLDFKLGFVNL